MKLIIEVEFGHELTETAQLDVQQLVHELKDELEYRSRLRDGKIVRADLLPATPAPPREDQT